MKRWNMSEMTDIVSNALASIYLAEASLYKPEINVKAMLHSIERCRYVLSKLLENLEMYLNGEAPKAELIALIMEAHDNTDAKKIRDRLDRAMRGLEKLIRTLLRKSLNLDILKDEDVIELEDVLRRLSDALGREIPISE